MTDPQWNALLRVIRGERLETLPAGLIIDCPWLPGWTGMSILDYLASDTRWLEANLRAVRRFPDFWLLPGFWSEFGMCTEPSAFGARCRFFENAFPSVDKCLYDYSEVGRVKKPDPRTDGLLPLVLKRLVHTRREIEQAGHRIRFAVARGPLNIASYLLGHTEFLLGVKISPEETHQLLRVVTDFLIDWLRLQAETFDSIEGVLLLDDLLGFVGDADFRQFALPYLRELYGALDVPVKALHNDARGMVTAKYLAEIGVNLFNFAFEHSLGQMREWTGPGVTLLGNIPPRDVLGGGTPDDVRRSAAESLATLADHRWLILSAGGGTPPGTPTENIEALAAAAHAASTAY
jgi:uroporphyrinogen decarboxylase